MKNDSKNEIESYLYNDDKHRPFSRVTEDLLTDPAFIALKPLERCTYIAMTIHKHSPEGNRNLYKALKEYDSRGIAQIADIDIQYETKWGDKHFDPKKFVFPSSVAKKYGIKYSTELSRIVKGLMNAGFIKRPFGDPPGKAEAIYEFCDDWKQKDKKPTEQNVPIKRG